MKSRPHSTRWWWRMLAAIAIVVVALLIARSPSVSPVPDRVSSSATPSAGDVELYTVFVEAEGDAVERMTGTVEEVTDGDTVVLRGGRTVRHLGIDAPERMTPRYEESRALNRQLVEGREVVLFTPRAKGRDRFSRRLAAVFVESDHSPPGSSDPVCVNTHLVAGGMALIYIKDDDVSRTLFQPLLLAQNQALDRGTGIWSASVPPRTEKVLLTRNRFHRPRCHHVSGRRRPIDTREKALRAGKSPCRTCKL